ncbi:MAG: DUF6440 family protein [Lawsonibacter sp.]
MPRFVVTKAETKGGYCYIVTDAKNGVQYLSTNSGVTVLVGRDGKPLIDEEYEKEMNE